MNLKKLSILGFKSFMDKFEIIFSCGINGVVGPNGCGKSNIVDAIRWVMGEQSPKQLRGRRMEDVIFSGSGECKPLGMAEVSLLFENGNGSFPLAFAHVPELSITRRLYRSGESEYLINNVQCRLKDIQEIFMDTGLGNRAYSIIGQGQIGAIIEQRPEETRVMIEEAAGVTKYRKKVAISQKKIEQTENNLQRVEDILSEVSKQIRSLKRQSAKAKRYKVICEEIRNLELILFSNNYNQLKKESGDRLKSTEDLVRQELAKSVEFSGINAQIETMNQDLEEKETVLSTLRKDFLYLKDRVNKKEAGLESLSSEIKMQDDMELRLVEEKEEIKKRLITLKEEREGIEEEIEKMKENSFDLDGEIALKEKRLKAKRELLKEIKEEYEKARSALNTDENKEAGLNHEAGYLNKMLDQITSKRSRLEKEQKDIKVRMDAIINASERKNLARESTVERLRDIETSIADREMNSDELEQIEKRVETEIKSAESELNLCQSRLAGLQSLTENFEGYKMGVRTIMKADDFTPRNEGRILGLVADIIKVEPEYEQAVEAVLGDRLQYIMVESGEDGVQAVEYLKNKAKGRCSFIPVQDFKEHGNALVKEVEPSLLRELVSVPEKYRHIINTLVGNTLLVTDLNEAVSAWKNRCDTPEGNGKDICFVTIDGDIVDQRGIISGGKLTKSSLLARKREMEVLKEKSLSGRRKLEDLTLELENITADIQEKKDELNDLTEEKHSSQEEINKFDRMLFKLGQELDQLEKYSKRITEDLGRKEMEEKSHREELSRIESEISESRERRKEEQDYFQKKEIELKEMEEEFDQFRDKLTKLKTDYRIFAEERRSLQRDIERLNEYADDSLKRLKKIEDDIDYGKKRRDECVRREQQSRHELTELYQRLKDAEVAVNNKDHDRHLFINEIKEKENTKKQLREEIDQLKDKINMVRMEHSERQFKMTSLAEVIKDKFNLNLLEIYKQNLIEDFDAQEVEEKLKHQKNIRENLGEVNLTAIKEHEALQERYKFIKNQREDLLKSIEDLRITIKKINRTSVEKFMRTFVEIDNKLKEIFPILFNGGTANLKLIDETKPLDSGILVEAHPPGKKLIHMGLMSGGEKALLAMAIIFAIYMIKPSPFCLLDEVDAPLDEANIDRFNNLLGEIKKTSQIIMVTHSRKTMEISDRLYGITMEKAGVSKTVSVDIKSMQS